MATTSRTEPTLERRLIKRDGAWQTQSGDPVYTLHNRPLGDNWLDKQMEVARHPRGAPPLTEDALAKHLAQVESGLQAIRAEWQDHLKGPIGEAAAQPAGAQPSGC